MRRRLGPLAILAALVAVPSPARGQEDLARHVDPLIGTAPPGFVFPGAVAPFGMVQNSPDTEGYFAYSGYLYTDQLIRGFSWVHLSGPGVKKGGDLPFMPTVGPVSSTHPLANASKFEHATEDASPGEYRVRLERYGIDVSLTASRRAGMQRYRFPPSPTSNVLVDVGRSAEESVYEGSGHDGALQVVGDDELAGWTDDRYRVYFVAKFDRPFKSFGTWRGDSISPGSRRVSGRGAGGLVTFDTTGNRHVQVKVGISFVDLAGARRNLVAEAPGFDYARMRAATRAAWNRELASVRLTGGLDADRASFYTALYRSFLHPNVFADVDGRYMGFDKRLHRAEGRTHYANFSSWDLYKSQHQLLALLKPRRYRDMVLSLLHDALEAGRIPRWGEQNFDARHMSGDPAVPGIVDAYCRGVLDPLPNTTLRALYRELTQLATSERSAVLRTKGYLPGNAGTTLEHGVADFALALMAQRLGKRADARRWLAQSLNYRNILDPETRWMRPRNADGSWMSPFDPTEDRGFQEGNSWQYSWLAPHDARGLFDRMGGDAVARDRLDTLFSYEAAAATPGVVAEAQTKATLFGLVYRTNQYAPGNEHDLQVPWMYPFARQPWKTQAVQRQLQFLYRPTPDGLPGNDDLGGLSSWYVFSALGFGPVTPGAPFYVVGSPRFVRAVLAVPGGDFTVEAPGASVLAKYVRSAALNGAPLHRPWLYDADLRPGGKLQLAMAGAPNEAWASGPGSAPPSVTGSRLPAFGCRGRPVATRSRVRRLRLRVRPRRVVAGERVRLRFRVTARRGGRWRPVRGARVRFAGRTRRTTGRGFARMSKRFRRPGRFRVRASRRGYRGASAAVRVLPRPRDPRFTG